MVGDRIMRTVWLLKHWQTEQRVKTGQGVLNVLSSNERLVVQGSLGLSLRVSVTRRVVCRQSGCRCGWVRGESGVGCNKRRWEGGEGSRERSATRESGEVGRAVAEGLEEGREGLA
jgi:hypothetical protein